MKHEIPALGKAWKQFYSMGIPSLSVSQAALWELHCTHFRSLFNPHRKAGRWTGLQANQHLAKLEQNWILISMSVFLPLWDKSENLAASFSVPKTRVQPSKLPSDETPSFMTTHKFRKEEGVTAWEPLLKLDCWNTPKVTDNK